MLTFTVVEKTPVTIISLQGRFDATGAMVFEEEFKKVESLFPVIDLSCVNYLSSAGIRIILQSEKILRSQNGKIIFASMQSAVKQVLEITGLASQFTIVNTLDDAKKAALQNQNSGSSKFNQLINHICYSVKTYEDSMSTVEIWRAGKEDKDNLAAVSLKDFSFSIGKGGLGLTREDVKNSSGQLLIVNKLLSVLPGQGIPDFIFSENPADTYFYLNSSINFSGTPSLLIEIKEESITLKEFLKNSFNLISDITDDNVPIAGFVLTANPAPAKTGEGILSVGVAVDKLDKNEMLDELPPSEMQNLDTNLFYKSAGITLEDCCCPSLNENTQDAIKSILDQENLTGISEPDLETQITFAKLWIFIPELRDAQASRLKIEFENLNSISDEFEIIIRKIYSDCSSIKLQQLHGGFSAKTFRVYGYDKRGIRILPTVLKLAKIPTIQREAANYEENVKRYILNNGTSIMGNSYYGEFGGIRYNFVGITGPDSQIGWLTNYYIEKSADELLPLFDRIFTDVLRPWYGQPRLETFYPFKEHNPTFVFFPEMFEECEKELGISADCEKIFSEELGREIINPYWFLKYGYKEREKKSKLWYKCICHGDLNMQNILLDELKNIYVIDYSETCARNAVADFARLEPIFKFEFTKLESEEDIKSLLTFEEGLLKANKLDELPQFAYKGSDPNIPKAFELICRLRQYANTVTLFETDIIPYLLAVLEWTYSIVCYQSVNKVVKRASALSAALICEKILELEGK